MVEDTVHAVSRNPPSFGLRNRFGNVIGRRRALETRQRLEHRLAHRGPLLTLFGQPVARRIVQRFAFVKMVIMTAHAVD